MQQSAVWMAGASLDFAHGAAANTIGNREFLPAEIVQQQIAGRKF